MVLLLTLARVKKEFKQDIESVTIEKSQGWSRSVFYFAQNSLMIFSTTFSFYEHGY